MEDKSLAKMGHVAASLPSVLLRLVQDIEAHRMYPQLIAAHVACVQMDTSTPRLAQLERDLMGAQRSIGAELGQHSFTAGQQAAAPEVDAFMEECLNQLVRLKAALESHVAAATRACENYAQTIEHTLGQYTAATPPGGLTLSARPPSERAASSRIIARPSHEPGLKREAPDSTCEAASLNPPHETDQRTSTAMLIRRCLQRDAQLDRAEVATRSRRAGTDKQGEGGRRPERAVAATMARELRNKLDEQYSGTLEEVRNEILRKRQAGRLPGTQGHLLKDWWSKHESWPYPTDAEKQTLAMETGLTLKQVSNWFINQRKRNWKPV